MKIKLDFVTNSSTTSFVAWGTSLSVSNPERKEQCYDACELYHYFGGIYKCLYGKELPEGKEYDEEYQKFVSDWRGYHTLSDYVFNKYKANAIYDYNGNCLYIGISPEFMGDDETKAQVIQRVKQMFKDLGLKGHIPYIDFIAVEVED